MYVSITASHLLLTNKTAVFVHLGKVCLVAGVFLNRGRKQCHDQSDACPYLSREFVMCMYNDHSSVVASPHPVLSV